MNLYYRTCSIFNLKNDAVTFVRKGEYLKLLLNTDKNVMVITPHEFLATEHEVVSKLGENIYLRLVDRVDVDRTFFEIHNNIHKDFTPPPAKIGNNCVIHDSVVMDVDGLKLANCSDGRRIQFKHTGNIIIEDDVEIGPLCVIHRGTMDSTIIKQGVKMASKINIGHNAIIGENTAIASGAILAGSKIGKNCWIGMAAIINQGLSICDNVVIGAGSLVTKDIDKPGIYVGSPVKFLKPIEKGWNF